MFDQSRKSKIQIYRQNSTFKSRITLILSAIFLTFVIAGFTPLVNAQSPVNGGFEGRVTDNGTPLAGVLVQFENQANGFKNAKITNSNGVFRQTMLQPGVYIIRVTLDGYKPFEQTQQLFATRSNSIVPVPVNLERETVATTTPSPNPTPDPVVDATPSIDLIETASSDDDQGGNLNPRRDGAFDKRDVRSLPLGGTTLTRTFDELAFLIPGVAPPPQAIGNSVGPGIGGGVGTSGQFSVNGLRSRANNFLVDGADNNDEDIGVRRQGFFALVPQPIESIQEFQIITLLAPAEFGRNLGAQVNALSKSGGNSFHGSVYGLFNFHELNAPDFFDTTSGNTTNALTAVQRNGNVIPVTLDGTPVTVTNEAGSEDKFSLLQGGFAIGGPIVKNKAFFFISGEGQTLDATKERNFAVPTVEQRGLFNSGAEGLNTNAGDPVFPTSLGGDAVFSLFPFPNNPAGIYGRNTYTKALSADAWGRILSGKIDWNIFSINGNPQTFTARYNYTDDSRDLTDVGGALFSSIRPSVRTDNISTFLSGGLTNNISNELRFSFGRTRLRFEELRDDFLLDISSNQVSDSNDRRFLLNARSVENFTLPGLLVTGCVTGAACYLTSNTTTADSSLGPIGQLIISGFSPVGVDVFNFPQERKNNTYQIADVLRWQIGDHSLSFGTDIRRTVLDSNLPRNSRPLVTFNGGLDFSGNSPNLLANPLDLAASGASSGFFQSLVLPGNDANIELSYYQLNFFAQNEWRISRNLLLSFGLRYEYNTPPEEADRKIESTFQTQAGNFPSIFGINLFQGFNDFIAGRNGIFDSDRNNFAPRIGFAWSATNKTVIRGGYGIYYDQILGAVVSQSRNVFPTFSTFNTGGGELACNRINPFDPNSARFFTFLNPISGRYNATICPNPITGMRPEFPLVLPGTLNTINTRDFDLQTLLTAILGEFPFENGTAFGATIPARKLDTPFSHQYSIGIEQEIFDNNFLSVAYVGTIGRNLLRFTTPNLGNNYISRIDGFQASGFVPIVNGTTFDPYSNPDLTRPNNNVGPINQFETTGRSRYDSLQIGFRGRLIDKFQYRVNYVYGKVKDDVSDVFDLAGASALPQNSITEAGEYAAANFDVRHRFTYNFIYDLPSLRDQNALVKFLFGDWSIAGTGKFNTGQPFTVNSIFDVNLDGNLTDRLDNTQLIRETGDRQQPLVLTGGTLSAMLAPIGQDGSVPRNSFRAGSILELDLSFLKRFTFDENKTVELRFDVFNFINRANFGVPVRFLEAPGFGKAVDTVTPGRRVQFGVKIRF